MADTADNVEPGVPAKRRHRARELGTIAPGSSPKGLLHEFSRHLSDPRTQRSMRLILNNPNHKHFAKLVQIMAGYVLPRLLKLEGTLSQTNNVLFFIPANGRDAEALPAPSTLDEVRALLAAPPVAHEVLDAEAEDAV